MSPHLAAGLVGILEGGALGASFGAAAGGGAPGEQSHRGRSALRGGLIGAGIGGLGLGGLSMAVTPRAPAGMRDLAPWMKNVQSQAEAKSAFRANAMKMHPDLGGSDAGMQQLNEQWNRIKNHPEFSAMKAAYDLGKTAALGWLSR